MKARADLIPEPELIFGHNGRHVDPKSGLALYGPAGHARGGGNPTSITLGFVGPARELEQSRVWLSTLNGAIDNDKENQRLFPPFPGMEEAFGCKLILPPTLEYEIPPRKLESALDSSKPIRSRVTTCAGLYSEGVTALSEKAGRPNVVICPWSETVIDACGSGGVRETLPADLARLKRLIVKQDSSGQTRLQPFEEETLEALGSGRSGWNLHAQIKSDSMASGLPVQILEPRTFSGQAQVEDPTTPWNLATGLFYKGGGIPWRPAVPETDTCYVGIEFYNDKTSIDSRMMTCIAQVFSDLGEGLVLRGGKIRVPSTRIRTPKMDSKAAEQLLLGSVELYRKHNRRPPRRVTVHKSSHFTREEREGIARALGATESYDLLTVFPRGKIRFFRQGMEPPLRGTTVELTPSRSLVYTSGYVPYLRAYPGLRVPQPLTLVHAEGPSGVRRLSEEALKLTKLNWNSARFSNSVPATLMYASFVKAVLAQTPESTPISESYSSYM